MNPSNVVADILRERLAKLAKLPADVALVSRVTIERVALDLADAYVSRDPDFDREEFLRRAGV